MRIRYAALVAFAAAIGHAQTITTLAGTPPNTLPNLGQIARDSQGNLYFWAGQKILVLTTAGVVNTAVGSGNINNTLANGPALSINLGPSAPNSGVATDAAGNVYISDKYNQAIRVFSAATGMVTTIAGTGSAGYSGDGGPATKATLNYPQGVAVDSAGNVYIADTSNNRVRKVNSATGVITTFAGNGNATPVATDGVPATSTGVEQPSEVAVDSAGNVYIAEDNRIRKVDTSGIIHMFAGTEAGGFGFSGDGGPATSAALFGPLGMAFDSAGNLYFADNQNQRIRKVSTAGIISTIAGVPGNVSTPTGDGGPATAAYLGTPLGLVFDPAGDLIFTDNDGRNTIREIAGEGGSGGSTTPSLTSSPASLSFAFSSGGTAPASQSLDVSSTGAALTFTAVASTSAGNWLSIGSAGGTTPATISVSVNPSGLSASATPYQGEITLTPSGGSPMQVSVTLTVSAAGAPLITPGGIVNASGYQTTLAPDTVFVIFGSNMGPAVLQAASAPTYPSSLGGTSITFAPQPAGVPITAKMIYTSAGQIAGLLPSSISAGTYAVSVTYNQQSSAPQNVTVAARSFGIAAANSAGSGEAQATIANVNGGISLVRLTTGSVAFEGFNWTLSPAHPGDTLVLWGTGGGADAANDTGGSSGDQTAAGNFSVSVDGTEITPLYAGTSQGYPGLWQINFTLPSTMAADCFATLQVSAGGQLSNIVTIAIGAAGQTSCSSTISQATLAALDSGGNVTMAGLVVGELTYYTGGTAQVSESVGGVINQYTAAAFLLPYSGPKVGGCAILQETYPVGGREPSGPSAQLDAGTLTISGPGVSSQTVGIIQGPTGPVYNSSLANGSLQGGGTYTLTGAGGTQVGPFTGTGTFPNNFTSNLSSLTTVNHAQPLTITWTGTGFNVTDILIIGDVLTSTTTHGNSVTCVVPADLGTFTVPVAALAYLPPSGTWQIEITATTNQGGVASAESSTSTALTPPLVAGGQVSFGAFTAYIAYIVTATVQ
jgi:uncharacterized protein (TIGR03437 family)